MREGQALAHPLNLSSVPAATRQNPYWRDVGTVDAFWAANLDLASNMPELNIYDRDWPIWTYQEQLPPAKFVPDEGGRHGEIANVMVSGGCIVSGSDLTLLGRVLQRAHPLVLQDPRGGDHAGLHHRARLPARPRSSSTAAATSPTAPSSARTPTTMRGGSTAPTTASCW